MQAREPAGRPLAPAHGGTLLTGPAAAAGSGRAPLAGSPALPFAARFYLHTLPVFRLAAFVGLATLLVVWLLLAPSLPPAGHAWLAIQCTLLLVEVWRCTGGRVPPWHELLVVLLRLNSFGLGVVSQMARQLLDRAGSQDDAGSGWHAALRYAMLLQLASGATTHLMVAFMPLRLSLALPVQLAVVLSCAAHNRHLCGSPSLSSPAALEWGHTAFAVLDSACFSLAPQATRVTREGMCAALLSFQQLTISLFVPSVAQAVLESGMFERHQQQRRTRRLPKEGGWQAQVYAGVSGVAASCDCLALLASGWVLLGILWHLAVVLAATGA